MSRHLNSRALDPTKAADLNAQLFGAHKKPPTSVLAAMEQVRIAAEKKDSEQALRDRAIAEGLIQPMSQYTEEDIDVYLEKGRRADELDAQIDAEERDLIASREKVVKNMTEGELQMLAIFGWKDGEGAIAEPANKNKDA